MDQKARVRNAMVVLSKAILCDLPEVDDSAMGPFSLTKALLKGGVLDVMLTLPAFEGTWLHMLGAEVGQVAVEGQIILPGLLPPAAMLAAQAQSEEDRQVLASGVTVSIRPPHNDLLVLSPASGDPAVYEVTDRGVARIASSVAEFVEREVELAVGRSLGKQLPDYGFDGQIWSVLVAGRRVVGPATQGDVKRVAAAVRAFAEKSGLPLAYVHMGTPVGADEDEQMFDGVVGWVLAQACGHLATPIDRAALDAHAAEKVPSELFDVLGAEHGVTFAGDAALWLAPAGWSSASLHDVEGDGFSEESLLHAWVEEEGGVVVELDALPPRFGMRVQRG